MWLLLEIGNSRLKWATWHAEGYIARGALVHAEPRFGVELGTILAGLMQPERILLASVADAGVTAVVEEAVRRTWRREPARLVTRARQGGVSNAYADAAQMGVDRWLALIAAHRRWRAPVCVVDAGTAVTVDVLDAGGTHLGGLIGPGLDLWCSLLQARTAGIGAGDRSPVAALGASTSACVANGSLLAVVGMVEFALKSMRATGRDDGVLVVTGGGAAALMPHLPVPAVPAPDLVFDGMRFAAEDMHP